MKLSISYFTKLKACLILLLPKSSLFIFITYTLCQWFPNLEYIRVPWPQPQGVRLTGSQAGPTWQLWQLPGWCTAADPRNPLGEPLLYSLAADSAVRRLQTMSSIWGRRTFYLLANTRKVLKVGTCMYVCVCMCVCWGGLL